MDPFTSAFAAIKTATGIVQGVTTTMTQVAINEVKIGLQQALLTAQQALFSAQQKASADNERARELEQEIVRLRDWSAEKQNYTLVGIQGGAAAYMLKPAMQEGQPPHWLCTNCYANGQPSILQPQAKKATTGVPSVDWRCPICSSAIAVDWMTKPKWT